MHDYSLWSSPCNFASMFAFVSVLHEAGLLAKHIHSLTSDLYIIIIILCFIPFTVLDRSPNHIYLALHFTIIHVEQILL